MNDIEINGTGMKGKGMKGTGKSDKAQDPKGLIFEAYRIAGITPSQCRSIFLDWALSLPDELDSSVVLRELLTLYGEEMPDHPMTEVLQQGLTKMSNPRRRGGWRARERD